MSEQTEPTVTVGNKTYEISDLSAEVREMLSLHEQAVQMAVTAKRQAAIHDLAVANIASMVEKALKEAEE
jgi:hypothetical protein